MKSLLLFAAHFMCLLVGCRSQATTDQAAAAMADGLDMFAMAKAIPYLQNPDGAPFKFRHHLHLHYFTCRQADKVDYLSQEEGILMVTTRGQQVPHPITLIFRDHLLGASSLVLNAVQILKAMTIGALLGLIGKVRDLRDSYHHSAISIR